MIIVQNDDFDVGHEVEILRQQAKNAGAIVTFTGLVREIYSAADTDRVTGLFLEHYPGMTEKALQEIADQACQKWEVLGLRVIHRVGALKPQDQIVLVATASAHRQHAFAAAEFVMDYLKTNAPFWKKQTTANTVQWVEHRQSDDQALKRWQD